MVVLFPRLAKLFCLCKCLPFLCYSLILSPLLLEAGFGLSLASFWGYLKFVSCALDYSIGSFEPSRTASSRFFTFFLIELFKSNGRINMVLFLLVAMLVFALYSKRSFRLAKGLWQAISLLFKRNILVLQMVFFSSLIG